MKTLILSLLIIPTLLFANPEPIKGVNWITFEKAIELNKTNPKPILIDVYTDWCTWCHKMEATTYKDPVITSYINKNFYAVKFNAEQKETIKYRGETFNYIQNGRRGYHELAYVLLKGKLSYPSTVFLNKEDNLIDVVPGYLKAPQMEQIVSFMSNEAYLKKDFTTYIKEDFKSKLN